VTSTGVIPQACAADRTKHNRATMISTLLDITVKKRGMTDN
jgi:hypothetical protein